MDFRVRKVFGSFEKHTPGVILLSFSYLEKHVEMISVSKQADCNLAPGF